MCVKLLHANGIRMDTNRLIYFYFSMGLTYKEIICFLGLHHRILMSERSLQRNLGRMNLYRRKNKTSLIRFLEFLSKLIMTDDMQSGYRWMYQRCLLAGYRVSRCGRYQYLYHCLNIFVLCINKEFSLI